MADETTSTKTTETTRTTYVPAEEKKPSVLSNILAIIGFIILIVIIIWGLYHIATLASPWFSSLFSGSRSAIRVTAPANVTSGERMTVSWTHSTNDRGTYAFIYQCRNDFRFEIAGAGGTSSLVPCGATLSLPENAGKTLTITPYLTGTAAVPVPMTIIFMPAATTSKQVQGSATTTVRPATGATPSPSPLPSPIVIGSSPTPAPSPSPTTPRVTGLPAQAGPSDLSVRIISATVDQWGNGRFVFDIANVGGSPSGSYTFSAQLPTNNYGGYGYYSAGYSYVSPLQASLGVGDHIVNTLNFSQAVSGTASVTLDRAGGEVNVANNSTWQSVSAPYYNNYNYDNTYYAPQRYEPYPYYQQAYQNPYPYTY